MTANKRNNITMLRPRVKRVAKMAPNMPSTYEQYLAQREEREHDEARSRLVAAYGGDATSTSLAVPATADVNVVNKVTVSASGDDGDGADENSEP